MESITKSRTTTTVQMPIGYRFCPTDEEIIIHYLRPKVLSFPLPATAILHSDNFFNHHPSQLPGDPKEKRYFFCKTSDTKHALNPSGYWKPILKNKNINTHNQLILATGCNHPIGFKNSFVFYQFSDNRQTGSKTPWILHQFRLLYPLPIKMEEWVVCSIHMKSKKVKSLHQGPTKKQKKSHSNKISHYKQEEEEEEEDDDDVHISSVSENVQKLSVQEEEHTVQPEEDIPSVVIPNHLQVHTADCSHLSFGSFGANLNTGLSRPSSVDQSETTNLEYYEDGPTRTLTGTENYELPSASQSAVLKQEDPEVTHGTQSQYGFSHNPQLLNPSFPQSQTPAQTQISTPFLNVMQAAANGHPVRESDLAYSQFSASQPMPTRYANSASSINDPTISMAEALKSVGISSSQPAQQTSLPTGPGVPQHVSMHPYSQGNLPLGPFTNMIGYPYMPQSYTYMPSGFQPTFAGNSSYHQQLAAMLPQYKNSVSASSLPQSAGVSGYGSFGGSTAVPGNYQFSQPAGPAGSTLNYEDVLNAHYKDNSHLLSLQQQNENSPMWVHGGGSRVPASAYYNLQSQNQNVNQNQASGFRQGQQQQPSQNYGGAALNYPDFFHSQTGISQEHQLQQNPRDGSLVGGSQGQPKLQSQQLWQNGY